MKTSLFAALLAGLLTVAGAAAVASSRPTTPLDGLLEDVLGHHGHAPAGADEAAMHHGMAGDAHDAQLGMDRPRFAPAQGSTPTADDAKKLEQVSSLRVNGDHGFTPKAGVRSGSGTLADPYVISGYAVTGSLYLGDTDACVVITGNYVDGELALNWNGNCVHVHHNFIRDLRVNENVAREGDDTGGLIELNTINYVGQIRHYDGEFRNNVVGPRDDAKLPFGVFQDPENLLPFAKDTRVLNIDGFNQGWFHHNTITGSVDLKLHGHHHSTGFLATHSHYHGDNATRLAMMQHDHTNRWESVRFEDNKVVDPAGYGVRYTDEAHAGDDRTAPSETTKSLGDDHQHHTKVTIARNTLVGAGLWVDVFNADDKLHTQRNPGWFWIVDNTIQLQQRHDGLLGTQMFGQRHDPNTGIRVDTAKEMQMDIRGNTLSWQATSSSDPTADLLGGLLRGGQPVPVGIALSGVRDGDVSIMDNRGTGFTQGVAGFNMDKLARWAVAGNDFPGAAHPVYYDESVANQPTTQPVPPLADPGAWGPGAEPMDESMAGMHHHGT
ncbi:MAG: hypothetical protein QOI63_1588 [Thermoplasmata archaeon]|jgi:hypothetical protein|nr:hypothetical protein [Thermoplasmata archaeon]